MGVRGHQYRRSGNALVCISIFGRKAGSDSTAGSRCNGHANYMQVAKRLLLFWYELVVRTEKEPLKYFGRACKDVVKGGWVLAKGDRLGALK